MKKHLINTLGHKYIYFVDIGEDRKSGYIVSIGELHIINGKIRTENVTYKTDNASDLIDYLKGVENEK